VVSGLIGVPTGNMNTCNEQGNQSTVQQERELEVKNRFKDEQE
jgi:hypothetical protein